ncbi:MAG: hypothetical protein LBR09_03090 [Endomicrobium sp.]|jgi:hypothetical protein|nr:hypothetical protein [Endomicrobium sp.]
MLGASASFLTGCSILNYLLDYPNRALGFSIKKFENEKIGRFSSVFKIPKVVCFDKILDIIKNLKAKVRHKDFRSGYIIAYNFANIFDCCLNSTELGIFITDMKNGNVKVEIISNNSLLAKKFSVKFFEMLASK